MTLSSFTLTAHFEQGFLGNNNVNVLYIYHTDDHHRNLKYRCLWSIFLVPPGSFLPEKLKYINTNYTSATGQSIHALLDMFSSSALWSHLVLSLNN